MRIEKRYDAEYLIDPDVPISDCDEIYDGQPCVYHINNEHMATYPGEGDGEHRICARWPIETKSISYNLRSHIRTKLVVAIAVLDEKITPDKDLPKGRVKPALQLVREALELLDKPEENR